MFIPDIYKNENQAEIREFISNNGFAILVNQTDNKLWATHIPLYLDVNANGNEILVGHVAIENPQSKSLTNDSEVLAIFSGAHSYISASWYDHENVSTWNYLAVHAYGLIKLLNLEETILSLKKLTDKYEAFSENPIRVEDLSTKTIRQARGILAFEIEISSIEATKKLSQNRDSKNYKKIISELEKIEKPDAKLMATEMKKCPR